MYASSKVARDRDRLREQVLEGLGWRLYHLWSTDWYRNREVSKERLIKVIEQSKIDTIKDDEKREEEERKFKAKMEAEKQKRLEELKKAEEEEKRKKEEAKRIKEQKENDIAEDDNVDSDVDNPDSKSPDIPDTDYSENDISNKDSSNSIDDNDTNTNNHTNNDDKSFDSNENHQVHSSNENGELEDVLSIDDNMISELKNEAEIEIEKDSTSNNSKNIDNKPNNKIPKLKTSLNDNNDVNENKTSSADRIKDIGSFIGSKLSSIKSNHNKDDLENDNSINNQHQIEKVPNAKKDSISYANDKYGDNDNKKDNEKDNDMSNDNNYRKDKLKKPSVKKPKPKKKTIEDGKILASDDEYEYVEVPIDRELKDGEELVEYVNDDEYEIVEVPIDKELDDDEELIGYVERDLNDNKVSQDPLEHNENEGKSDKNVNSNEVITDYEDDEISDDDLENVIGSIINHDTSEDSPLNTYVKIHESNPAVNDNHDLNILNDNDLKESKIPSNQNNEGTAINIDDNESIISINSNESGIDENTEDNQSNTIQIDQESNIDEDFITISDAHSPLRKNNIYYNKNNRKNDSIFDKISSVKKELEYINNSLKEIENPTQPEVVHVIDRLSEDISEMEKSIDESEDIQFINDNGELESINDYRQDNDGFENPINEVESHNTHDTSSSEDIPDNIFDEYINDSDVLNSETDEYITDSTVIDAEDLNNIKRSQSDDEELENIIEDFDSQYKEIEKKRHNENNQLKAYDTRKLPKKGKTMKDYIEPYVEVSDLDLKSPDDVYDKALSYLSEQIAKIVDVEGPVHKEIVIKRIKEHAGIKRAGSKLKSTVGDGITYGEKNGQFMVIEEFLYPANLDSNIQIRERVKPNIDYISNDEIAANIKLVLLFKEHLSIDKLTKTVARNFGFKSTSKKTASKINNIIDLMLAESIVENIQGEIQLKN